MSTARILEGDCLDVLATLPERSVQTCITSPPYYGLRDYGTGTWTGGDPECDHTKGRGGHLADSVASTRGGAGKVAEAQTVPFTGDCGKCGATRTDSQIGLEETPEQYVANLVAVFREVRRVLRDDGTAWLNLGDSMSVGTSVLDELQRLVKGTPIFCGDGAAVRVAGKGVDVPLHHDGSPQGELVSLLGVQRVTIKKRDDDLGQVLHLLASPAYARVGVPIRRVSRDAADLEIVLDTVDDVSIIVSNLEADVHAVFGVPRIVCDSGEQTDAALAVEESREPVAERVGYGEALRHSVLRDAACERVPDVDLVDKAVSLRDCLGAATSSGGDLRICAASPEHLKFGGGDTGWDLTFRGVGHLFLSDGAGGLRTYGQVYAEATANANERAVKQELGVPHMVRRALMRDGWICRSTIIWNKPNPMPESVTDRPTKAHEYLFLLSKSARYFYDADAVREDDNGRPSGNGFVRDHRLTYQNDDGTGRGNPEQWEPGGGRNKRSVWTVATQPFPGAHFATFPPKLIEPCVLAGSSPQACAECGAPWERVTETVGENSWAARKAAGQDIDRMVPAAARGTTVSTEGAPPGSSVGGLGWVPPKRTTGWQPTCDHSDGSARCTVLDPFSGAGTTGVVALRHDRDYIGVELNPTYAQMARDRIYDDGPLLNLILGDAA